ncbi:MAG: hypothetical protein IH845_05535 [Nanoarchaeota archaeon]|nr:hypothetical protein [Nanoarchaeota archaeon]
MNRYLLRFMVGGIYGLFNSLKIIYIYGSLLPLPFILLFVIIESMIEVFLIIILYNKFVEWWFDE